ncbi:putative glycosyltransferase [Mizugakiibacter sediminis]|uniref:Glycosyl transferase family 2 n=1 Tax=Mizugakiibacter sediminis TaxID=1475481 RepID=A0A0K8QR77_9GAMM|nr:glycosyltransferase family 2 protein [Mizugakiibacter sediminis]GAP67141.1 putative glycosyltransferase [Mizugakiibacter sediminis]
MSAPRVSVIVVAADSGATLLECAARALASEAVAEFVLVDNASGDGMPEALERAHAGDARLRVLRNGANLGFGPAVNRGAAQARGEALLVLNPDCLLEHDTVARLLAVLDAHPQAGLVGAVVCDADGRPDPASRRRDPLLRRALMTLTGLTAREAADARWAGVNVPGPMPAGVSREEAVSGALMLLPRRVFAALGGFDEGYFLHCEDLDLCRRVRDAGYAVLLAGGVRVPHAKGGSSRHRPAFVAWHKHRGMWRWFRKFDPAARNPLLAGLVWLGLWAHYALMLPRYALSAWRHGRRAA